jgi:hypothetical protein
MFMFSLCKQKKAKVKVRMPGRRYNIVIDLARRIELRRAFHCIAGHNSPVLWIRIRKKNIPDPGSSGSKRI